MRYKVVCKNIFLSIVLLLTQSSFLLADTENRVPWRNTEVVMRGNYWEVLAIVFDDYRFIMLEKSEKKNKSEIGIYGADTNNYDAMLSENDELYFVWVRLRDSVDLPGHFGGDTSYIIDKKDLKIIKRTRGR